jgi:hypothetical protein
MHSLSIILQLRLPISISFRRVSLQESFFHCSLSEQADGVRPNKVHHLSIYRRTLGPAHVCAKRTLEQHRYHMLIPKRTPSRYSPLTETVTVMESFNLKEFAPPCFRQIA